jgi:hypothetical protein
MYTPRAIGSVTYKVTDINPKAHQRKSKFLRHGTREQQLEFMTEWFRDRFEDPAHTLYYESAEGGYQWPSTGGPYDAHDELSNEFGDVVPDNVIEDVAASLSSECSQWAMKDAYYDELIDAITANSSAYLTLVRAGNDIESLLGFPIPEPLANTHRRLLFANAIMALEVFLSDRFINRIVTDNELIQKYMDSDHYFRERKIAFKDVFREFARAMQEVKKQLVEMVWHNLGKVKALYRDVLDIDIGEIGPLANAVQIRHDIVHRNGRDKDGSTILVTREEILAVLQDVATVADAVESQIDNIQTGDAATSFIAP